ncbi:MAG: hypothetical protein SFT92_01455 [Rickettsiales bacterium]|nr:hypothetical protein [Rickettsiales bacterium]
MRNKLSDFDREPGNSSDSKSYSMICDPRSETEFTNLPEAAVQRQIWAAERRIAQQQAAEQRAALNAQRQVHFFPSVGKFIIPNENSWACHADLIKDPEKNLAFNPDKYVYFDKIIAEKFGDKALYDQTDPEYLKYEGLRTNLAVMRNDIIGMYLNDGGFDPGDEKYVPSLISIATAIGESLSNDKWYKRLFLKHFSVEVANVEAIGARELYSHLLELQTPPNIVHSIGRILGKPDRNWGLPPIEWTSFSDENLAKPLPEAKTCFTQEELAQLTRGSSKTFVERECERMKGIGAPCLGGA